MEKHIIRYRKIIAKIIKKSFPILKNKKIRIYEKKIKFSADAQKYPLYGLRIRTSPRLRNYSEKYLIGIFAHELSHLEDFEKRIMYHYFIRDFKKVFRKYVKIEESETDKTAIRKGYAKQLYAQRLLRWRSNAPKKIKELYLSPTEIIDYAKSINKW